MKRKSGNHSSKYALNPKQFENDLKEKHAERTAFKQEIRQLVIMNASKIDIRYKDLVEVALEIKKEFNL